MGNAELIELIDDAEACHRLTQFEQEFMQSMEKYVDHKNKRSSKEVDLSDKQEAVLMRIKGKVYAHG